MSKKLSIVCVILSVLALCVSVFCLARTIQGQETASNDLQFVLYLGTNDKDTNDPVFPPEEAKEKLKDILIQRFGGYTIQEADGGWIGDDGKEYQEHTLVIYLSDTTIEDVHSLCDELIEVYRQSSVLIQANETSTEFYYSQQDA